MSVTPTDQKVALTRTPTGIAIGCAYTAPPPLPSKDAEHVQRALLDRETHYAERALDFLERLFSARLMLAIAAVGFIAGTVKGLLRHL